MKEPCSSCDEKEKDFGGCRCQAYLLSGDMYAADPGMQQIAQSSRYSRSDRLSQSQRLS